MKINVTRTNQIITILIILIIVAAAISCIWLNDAQRIIVGIGAVLGIVNLLGLKYFFNKNAQPKRKK